MFSHDKYKEQVLFLCSAKPALLPTSFGPLIYEDVGCQWWLIISIKLLDNSFYLVSFEGINFRLSIFCFYFFPGVAIVPDLVADNTLLITLRVAVVTAEVSFRHTVRASPVLVSILKNNCRHSQ